MSFVITRREWKTVFQAKENTKEKRTYETGEKRRTEKRETKCKRTQHANLVLNKTFTKGGRA
jgi:hypothetical protein